MRYFDFESLAIMKQHYISGLIIFFAFVLYYVLVRRLDRE